MLPRNMKLLFTKSDICMLAECWNKLDNDIKLCNNCRLFNSNLKYFYIN